MTMGCLNCVWVGVALGRMALPSALEGVGVVYLETPSIGGTRPHDPVGGTICRRRAALRLCHFIHRRHAASGPSCAGGPIIHQRPSEARGLGTQLCWGAHHSAAPSEARGLVTQSLHSSEARDLGTQSCWWAVVIQRRHAALGQRSEGDRGTPGMPGCYSCGVSGNLIYI